MTLTDQEMWDIATKVVGAFLAGWDERVVLDIDCPGDLGDVVRAILAAQVAT